MLIPVINFVGYIKRVSTSSWLFELSLYERTFLSESMVDQFKIIKAVRVRVKRFNLLPKPPKLLK